MTRVYRATHINMYVHVCTCAWMCHLVDARTHATCHMPRIQRTHAANVATFYAFSLAHCHLMEKRKIVGKLLFLPLAMPIFTFLSSAPAVVIVVAVATIALRAVRACCRC